MKTYSYTINGAAYEVQIESIKGSTAKVNVNGLAFDVEIHGSLTEGDLPNVEAGGAPAVAPAPAPVAASAAPTAAPAQKGAAGAGTPVKAPLPGVITKVLVAAGQSVKKGETVVVLEAMKMENNITAECDGAVTGICCAAGDSVMEGDTLVTIG